MKFKMLVVIACVLGLSSKSQNKAIEVNSTDDLMEVIPEKVSLRFPQFSEGIAYFKNGNATSAFFNYNLLLGEMQFIDAKGDTLSIANVEAVDYITIGNTVFYYVKGFYELITESNSLKLTKKERFEVADKQKIGGYGQASSSGSIDNYSTYTMQGRPITLTVREKVLFKKYISYYILSNNGAVIANKSGFIKAFPGRKKSIETFLSENNINFKKEDDLKKLFKFLG